MNEDTIRDESVEITEESLPIQPDVAEPEEETKADYAPVVPPNPGPEPLEAPLSNTDALTAARLMQLLSEAEERGYMRARRELEVNRTSPLGSEVPLWGNPRRIEAENAEKRDRVELNGEFLSRVRPAIWD